MIVLNFHASFVSLPFWVIFFWTIILPMPARCDFEKLLDFQTALSQMVMRSTGVALEENNLGATQARNLPFKLAFLPTLGLEGRYSLSGTTDVLDAPKQAEIVSRLNLFRGGADIQGLWAANAENRAQRHQVDAAYLQAEKEAIQILITEIQKKKQLLVQAEMVRTRTELLRVGMERYRKGYLSLQEVQKLEVDLENAKSSLADAEVQEAAARAQLKNWLGNAQVIGEWPWLKELQEAQSRGFAEQPLDLTQRPDWLGAAAFVETEAYRLERSWRLLAPSIDFRFIYGTYMGYLGTATGWSGALTFTLPLFDHLTLYSAAKQQVFNKANREVQQEQIKRQAMTQWETSRISFQTLLKSALQRERNHLVSSNLYQDNQKRFRLGRTTANDLAIDQARMYDAELLTIQAWAAAHTSFVELCHALGRRVGDCVRNF